MMNSDSHNQDEIKQNGNLNAIVKEQGKRIEQLENLLYQGKEILTLEEAALFLGVTRSQLYKLTHRHVIPYFKPTGKLVYFEKSELLEWVKQNPVKSQSQINTEAKSHMQMLATR
jgi:excisionase family DNA binding protein